MITSKIDWFEKAETGYRLGYYTKEDVAYLVVRNRITTEQYEQIVGEEYPN